MTDIGDAICQRQMHDGGLPAPPCAKRRKISFSCQLSPTPHHLSKGRSLEDVVEPLSYEEIKGWETRLLFLEPGVPGSPLTARLTIAVLVHQDGVVVNHTTLLQYTALSYAWGEEFPKSCITISGHAVEIGMNLHAFLQQYRHFSEERVLWVDALCIDQKNKVEKSIQVAQMRDIYAKARDVVVWLGEKGQHTDFAIEYLNEHGPHRAYVPGFQRGRKAAILRAKLIDGAEDLYSRDWIRRMWVIQEVWAARKLSLLCGSSKLDWQTYLMGRTLTVGHDSLKIQPAGQKALECLSIMSGSSETELLKLMLLTSTSKYTNRRDRIYALLGMTTMRNQLVVDYDSSIAKVFATSTKHLMGTSGVSSILALDGNFGGYTDGEQLPSWCPDWGTVTPLKYYRPSARGDLASSFVNAVLGLAVSGLDTEPDPAILILYGRRLVVVGEDPSPPLFRFSWNGMEVESEPENHATSGTDETRRLLAVISTAPVPILPVKEAEASIAAGRNACPTCPPTRLGVPMTARKGDLVIAMNAKCLPLILRREEARSESGGEKFRFVGCAVPLYDNKEPPSSATEAQDILDSINSAEPHDTRFYVV